MTAFRRLGLLAPLAALSLAGCGINSVPTAEEQVNAKWGDLQADYQRRADLIPNLVATVKGYAQQEKTVLTQVTEARAKATSIQLNAGDLSDPAKVQAFQDAQSQLSGSIGRLLAASKPIPTSSPTRTSWRFRTSWKEPRTGSRSRAATIMSPCANITPLSGHFRPRSAPRSSMAPSRKCRSKLQPPRKPRRRSTSATRADRCSPFPRRREFNRAAGTPLLLG